MTVSNIVLEALKEVISVMNRQNLDYCLFGGLAMQGYKRIRATMDVDLMVAIDEKQISTFILNLEKSGFRFDRKKGVIKIGDFEILRFVYTDKKYQIDVFVDFATVKTEFQRQILQRKQRLDILGIKVNVASCEDLILLKILAARPLDKVDAEALVAENLKYVDKDYLQRWSKRLGIDRQLHHMLSRAKNAMRL